MTRVWHGLLDALGAAGTMTWQVTWSLILGFTLSAIVQALVKKSTIARLLSDDSPKAWPRPPGSEPPRLLAPTLPWRSRGRCFARAPTSPRQWPLRSRRPTWLSSWT